MELFQTVQQMSDDFHSLTNNLDTLIEDLSVQLGQAMQIRRGAGMSGVESQRTIAHLTDSIARATELRKSITLAHSSAEKDAEKADLPWACPEKATLTPRLRAVGQ